MEDITSILPAVAILIPLLASILILITGRYENLRESVTIVAAVAMLGSVLAMLPTVLQGNRITLLIIPMVPGGDFALKVDAFGMVFALVAAVLWLINSLYAIGYMRGLKEHAQTRFFFCMAVAIAAAIGIAFSANLLTLFIFYEILTIITYPLVVHIETPEAMKAGRKYLAYLLVGGIFLLAAVVLTYMLTGATAFVPGGFLEGTGSPLVLQVLFLLFMVGFVKAAWMPLHAWLPAAMIAPTPVSAFLHAVAVVTAGVFGIVRIAGWVYGMDLMAALGLGTLLAVIASFTIIVASLFALTEDNLKRRLAYSTVSQLSYILLGVSMLSIAGMTGAMAHIPIHAFLKITLFFVAGAIIVSAGRESISDMKGLYQKMPVTVVMFSAAAIGICGLPPLAGIISKIYLAIGAVEGGVPILLIVIIASAVLNAAYFLPIIYTMIMEKPEREDALNGVSEPPLTMLVPIVLTATISLLIFFFPTMPFLDLIEIAIGEISGGMVP
ncbi:formate hydrogenlyase subunit 3/multisubunit Na+/H+ antiporter MnhD subunit [Methanocalculus alkaliphilus]|uniref:proton-conducting transporter transmembrane domain-containing protein n=1 Tax=Methanocalculus alkaliphilus TaxID=768730 RepID=UPI00209E11A9|nr:proton-conducting transporter membrane subunit [Methanocalculus alkaliphilus]MCP1714385.1 formate hydrogenlyase subunit 3/multisubunit Na+/H+ antiporter MnhD subunit [Methanocalculus alkaliphilus]